jgi:hypothetical protein
MSGHMVAPEQDPESSPSLSLTALLSLISKDISETFFGFYTIRVCRTSSPRFRPCLHSHMVLSDSLAPYGPMETPYALMTNHRMEAPYGIA